MMAPLMGIFALMQIVSTFAKVMWLAIVLVFETGGDVGIGDFPSI